MSQFTTSSSCAECSPIYQLNQLAHMDQGGCLCFENLHQETEETKEVEDTIIQKLYFAKEETDVELVAEVECCICYESISTEKNNCITECGHQFCFKCLAKSMVHNGCTCPCCRSPLVEEVAEESDDEDTDADDDEDADDEDDDEDAHSEIECGVEELTRRLKANGFKMQDVLSMLLGRYTKGATDISITELTDKFDNIVDEADTELLEQVHKEAVEHEMMSNEDIHSLHSLRV